MAARNERRFVVRVFHPRGQYPRGRVALPEGLFWAEDDIVFCVTLTQRWSCVDEDSPYTEMDWLTIDELRFIGSILFCEIDDNRTLAFYPVHHYSPVIKRKNLDLTKHSTAEEIRDLVIRDIACPQFGSQAAVLQECLRWRYALVPNDEVDLSRQQQFWQGIKTDDYLLLRGLSALMKSDMLSRYSEFFEEATISCFIALEASFRMIIKRLKAEGIPDPNAKDGAEWVHKHFDSLLGLSQPLERYFAEFYDQRVMTLHPSSRFGEFPYPPLMHDDYFHLRRSLRSIFAYLVSGDHDKGFRDAVERHNRWGS